MISGHLYARRVQFADTDMAGMVHFSCYLRYVEEAEHALWREAGLSIADPASSVGFPRVAFTIEYLAPLRFEDEFEVDIRIEAISKRTIRYRSVIRRGGIDVATSTHTAVCVQRGVEPMRAVDLPDAILSRLAAAPGDGR
jgi:YbgC/YbaW family acyl-CoA thioester hydrolase